MLEVGTMGSISEGGICNRNDMILTEALEVWKFGKALGMSYDSDDNEIVSRFQELENQDWDEFDKCHLG